MKKKQVDRLFAQMHLIVSLAFTAFLYWTVLSTETNTATHGNALALLPFGGYLIGVSVAGLEAKN